MKKNSPAPARKKVGLWLRVSTEDQARGESPEHHEERGRQYAAVKEWDIAEVYHLEGVSGKAVIEHPEARRMLQDIETGRISGLIFSKLARLGRNTRELLEFADFFQRHDADLISLAESIDTSTPAGRFFYSMISGMAQWEREEIVERVKASVPIRAKLGKHLGGKAPFGYQWKEKKLVPDPQTAPVRKLVHELYLKHRRKNAVARMLNQAGHRTQNGKAFTAAGIRIMLHDSTPKGLHRANYMTSARTPGERYKPESDWIYHEVEPIISAELWDSGHQILLEQEAAERPKAKTPVQAFGGLTICGICETKMYVRTHSPKYVCGKCRNKIAIEDLEASFLSQIKDFFISPEELRRYLAEGDATVKEKAALLATLMRERDRLRGEMDRAFKLYMDESMSSASFAERFRPMEERQGQLHQEIPKLEAEIEDLKLNLLAGDEVFSQGQHLTELWPKMSPAEKQRAAEFLVKKIIIDREETVITLYYLPELMKQGLSTPPPGGGSAEPEPTILKGNPSAPKHATQAKPAPLSPPKIMTNSATTLRDPCRPLIMKGGRGEGDCGWNRGLSFWVALARIAESPIGRSILDAEGWIPR